jgi:aspartate-semialdehyde dehydrogenase
MPSVGVVGATGAVGTVELELLAERGYENVRAFASERSAGTRVPFGHGELDVELASPESLTGLDLCLFSVGTAASAELVPAAVENGAVCIDKSSAFRLADGVPLVVPEVNASRADEHNGIVANPNCSTIQLVCVLEPLRRAARLRSVRLATYQSASGAGDGSMKRLLDTAPADLSVTMDWPFEGDEFEEESKLRDETRKILELPDLPFMANCVRVPVLVGHCQAVWVETEERLSVEDARGLLSAAASVQLAEAASAPREAVGGDEVLVGRIRRDPTVDNGLVLFTACDNLRKGAALNALQIMERLAPPGTGSRDADLSARAPARTSS